MLEFDTTVIQYTAAMARDIANETRALNGSYLRKETNMIVDQIKSAANRGDYTLTVEYIDKIIISRLEALGFKVKVDTSCNETYTYISWNE